jgi:hypothetical protein
MTKILPIDFQPALISTMRFVLEAATAHIDNSSGKLATPATKLRIASCILKNAAEGVTDADALRFVAIQAGLCAAD